MIPKKYTEEQLQKGLEAILKTPEYISSLQLGEAKELLAFAKQEHSKIMEVNPEWKAACSGVEFLRDKDGQLAKLGFYEIMKSTKNLIDSLGELNPYLMADGRVVFTERMQEFCLKYNLEPLNVHSPQAVPLEILEQGIANLESFIKHPALISTKLKVGEVESQDNKTNDDKSELTMDQVALMCYYINSPITRDNGNEIAAGYGWNSKRSGEALYQKYMKKCKRGNRIFVYTKINGLHKQRDIEAILKYLDKMGKEQALGELRILEAELKRIEE